MSPAESAIRYRSKRTLVSGDSISFRPLRGAPRVVEVATDILTRHALGPEPNGVDLSFWVARPERSEGRGLLRARDLF